MRSETTQQGKHSPLSTSTPRNQPPFALTMTAPIRLYLRLSLVPFIRSDHLRGYHQYLRQRLPLMNSFSVYTNQASSTPILLSSNSHALTPKIEKGQTGIHHRPPSPQATHPFLPIHRRPNQLGCGENSTAI